jgi:hypothetical protein
MNSYLKFSESSKGQPKIRNLRWTLSIYSQFSPIFCDSTTALNRCLCTPNFNLQISPKAFLGFRERIQMTYVALALRQARPKITCPD